MNRRGLEELLTRVQHGEVTVAGALAALSDLPFVGAGFADLGFAKPDLHRELRTGVPEVIYGEGKTVEQIVAIAERLAADGQNALITRLDVARAAALGARLPTLVHHADARLAVLAVAPVEPAGDGTILIASAGTADQPVAEEAACTAELMGNAVERLYDVGVAGLHRLLAHRDRLAAARVVVVVAGMEGALPSVVGGLVAVPVIAVPTSVGYGASFGGLAALLAMMNSCAAGVTVVNVDNGFGAGVAASRINRARMSPRTPPPSDTPRARKRTTAGARSVPLTTGRARRVLKVGTLTTSVGSSYLWQALKRPFQSQAQTDRGLLDTHVRNATRIVEGSTELKGAFMKLVQMLSMRSDLLPAAALEVLSTVQSSVPPMDAAAIRKQITRELGAPPERLFAAFEAEAFAAASLGQVHRAELPTGEPVVVKIQYPGVEETVDQDLKNIRALIATLVRIGRDVMGQKIDATEVARELEDRLREELDYVNEAANLTRFRALFADDPEVVIPEPVAAFSSRRVLTMRAVDGYPLNDILAVGVDQSLKDWVAVKYFEVTWRQIFEFGVLHTDPHPGNYMVTHHPHLCMLDLGSVRVFEEPIRRAYLDLGAAMLADDEVAMRDCFLRLDFLDPGDDPAPLIRIMRLVFEPALVDADYDPRQYNSVDRAMEVAQISLEHRIFKSPGHRVFLFRALVGLESYVQQLGTVTNWRRVFARCVARAQAPRPARRSKR